MTVPTFHALTRSPLCALLTLAAALVLGGCQSSGGTTGGAAGTLPGALPQTVGVLFINDCEVFIRPPIAAGSYVDVDLAPNGQTVRASIDVSADDLAELRDYFGNPFESGGMAIDGLLEQGETTYLDFIYSSADAQIQVTGVVNGSAIDPWVLPVAGTPQTRVLQRIGEDNAGAGASSVRFYLRGFRTGFRLLDD